MVDFEVGKDAGKIEAEKNGSDLPAQGTLVGAGMGSCLVSVISARAR